MFCDWVRILFRSCHISLGCHVIIKDKTEFQLKNLNPKWILTACFTEKVLIAITKKVVWSLLRDKKKNGLKTKPFLRKNPLLLVLFCKVSKEIQFWFYHKLKFSSFNIYYFAFLWGESIYKRIEVVACYCILSNFLKRNFDKKIKVKGRVKVKDKIQNFLAFEEGGGNLNLIFFLCSKVTKQNNFFHLEIWTYKSLSLPKAFLPTTVYIDNSKYSSTWLRF